MACTCKTGLGGNVTVCDECAAEQIEALTFQGEELDLSILPSGALGSLMAQVDGWLTVVQQGQEEAGR
jgi:hypothetical protein